MHSPEKKFGDVLKTARESLRLTRSALGRFAGGIPEQNLYRWETNKNLPKIKDLRELLRFSREQQLHELTEACRGLIREQAGEGIVELIDKSEQAQPAEKTIASGVPEEIAPHVWNLVTVPTFFENLSREKVLEECHRLLDLIFRAGYPTFETAIMANLAAFGLAAGVAKENGIDASPEQIDAHLARLAQQVRSTIEHAKDARSRDKTGKRGATKRPA